MKDRKVRDRWRDTQIRVDEKRPIHIYIYIHANIAMYTRRTHIPSMATLHVKVSFVPIYFQIAIYIHDDEDNSKDMRNKLTVAVVIVVVVADAIYLTTYLYLSFIETWRRRDSRGIHKRESLIQQVLCLYLHCFQVNFSQLASRQFEEAQNRVF